MQHIHHVQRRYLATLLDLTHLVPFRDRSTDLDQLLIDIDCILRHIARVELRCVKLKVVLLCHLDRDRVLYLVTGQTITLQCLSEYEGVTKVPCGWQRGSAGLHDKPGVLTS